MDSPCWYSLIIDRVSRMDLIQRLGHSLECWLLRDAIVNRAGECLAAGQSSHGVMKPQAKSTLDVDRMTSRRSAWASLAIYYYSSLNRTVTNPVVLHSAYPFIARSHLQMAKLRKRILTLAVSPSLILWR